MNDVVPKAQTKMFILLSWRRDCMYETTTKKVESRESKIPAAVLCLKYKRGFLPRNYFQGTSNILTFVLGGSCPFKVAI